MRTDYSKTYEIKNSDSIRSLFGDEVRRSDNAEALKKNPIMIEFRKKIREIQNQGYPNNVPISEILLMVGNIFGYSWDTIPWGRFDEIIVFIKHNADRYIEYNNPEMHNYLITTRYYELSSTVQDRKLASIFMNNLSLMIERKCSNEEFINFGRQILNTK